MAINLVTEPSTSAPIDSTDYSAQNTLISANQVPKLSIFDDWEDETTEPLLKQGGYIRYAGNTYQVQTSDEEISGSCSSGANYIALTLSGTVLTASWETDISDYAFNPAYGGVYNSDTVAKMVLQDVCYLDGSDYKRGRASGMDFSTLILADGSISTDELAILKNLSVGSYITAGYQLSSDIIAGKTTSNTIYHKTYFNRASYLVSSGTVRVTFSSSADDNDVYDELKKYVDDGSTVGCFGSAITLTGTLIKAPITYFRRNSGVMYIGYQTGLTTTDAEISCANGDTSTSFQHLEMCFTADEV